MTTHDKIIFLLEFFYDNSRLPCINDTEIDGINLYEFKSEVYSSSLKSIQHKPLLNQSCL